MRKSIDMWVLGDNRLLETKPLDVHVAGRDYSRFRNDEFVVDVCRLDLRDFQNEKAILVDCHLSVPANPRSVMRRGIRNMMRADHLKDCA